MHSFRYGTVRALDKKVSRQELSRLTRRNTIHSPLPQSERLVFYYLFSERSNRALFLRCIAHSCERMTSSFHTTTRVCSSVQDVQVIGIESYFKHVDENFFILTSFLPLFLTHHRYNSKIEISRIFVEMESTKSWRIQNNC